MRISLSLGAREEPTKGQVKKGDGFVEGKACSLTVKKGKGWVLTNTELRFLVGRKNLEGRE